MSKVPLRKGYGTGLVGACWLYNSELVLLKKPVNYVADQQCQILF